MAPDEMSGGLHDVRARRSPAAGKRAAGTMMVRTSCRSAANIKPSMAMLL
jgi:hypothetical protein